MVVGIFCQFIKAIGINKPDRVRIVAYPQVLRQHRFGCPECGHPLSSPAGPGAGVVTGGITVSL